jgi:hypothetical protein
MLQLSAGRLETQEQSLAKLIYFAMGSVQKVPKTLPK